MKILEHFFMLEMEKVGCSNVLLSPEFYEEFCDPENDYKQLSIFKDICIIFAINSLKKVRIELHNFEDISTYLNSGNDDNIVQFTKPVNARELKASERDLKNILKAVKDIKKEKGYDQTDLIKQEDLINYITHADGRPISQSKLSRMLNDRMDCHIINIRKDKELYNDLVQSISNFRNIL